VRFLRGETALTEAGGRAFRVSVPLVDTFRVLHPGATEVGTGNGFVGRTGGPKIDHVLVPSSVRVVEARIVRDRTNGRYPSDHFPVLARVVFTIR
jgi:endonuclease/exonuclease/phosphatase family metal-dependent hydrolase